MYKNFGIYRLRFIFYTAETYRGWYLIPTIMVSWIFTKKRYSHEYCFGIDFKFLFLVFTITLRTQ